MRLSFFFFWFSYPPPPPLFSPSIQYVPSYFNIKTHTRTHISSTQQHALFLFFLSIVLFFSFPLSLSQLPHTMDRTFPPSHQKLVCFYILMSLFSQSRLCFVLFLLSFLSLFHLYLSLAIVRAKSFPSKSLRSLVFFFFLSTLSLSLLCGFWYICISSPPFLLSLLLHKQSWAFPTSPPPLFSQTKKNPQRTVGALGISSVGRLRRPSG